MLLTRCDLRVNVVIHTHVYVKYVPLCVLNVMVLRRSASARNVLLLIASKALRSAPDPVYCLSQHAASKSCVE